MKTLDINNIINEFANIGFIINPAFLKKESVDAPILEQVDLLLQEISDKGLTLTKKGNLPTKVVKSIAFHRPTPSEGRFLKFTKRFLEEEQPAATRTRIVCEIGKLVRKVKGKLVAGAMMSAYMKATDSEKYLYLLYSYSYHANLAYLDRMQEFDEMNGISFALLQLIRDKHVMYRETKVYTAILIDTYPMIGQQVEDEIEPNSYFSDNPYDEFELMVKFRLLSRFYAPFGLVQEHGCGMNELYECQKTELLDSLLLPHDAIDDAKVLNRKLFSQFSQRIKTEKLDIDLFGDFCYLYAQCGKVPLPTSENLADILIREKRLLGTIVQKQKLFYMDFADAIIQMLKQYTQLDGKGARSDLTKGFNSLVDAIFAQLPKSTPYNMFAATQPMTFSLFDLLVVEYKIDPTSTDFMQLCQERFDGEVVEDISALIYMSAQLEKKSKKVKRVNTQLQNMFKDFIRAYLLSVMSIYTYEL